MGKKDLAALEERIKEGEEREAREKRKALKKRIKNERESFFSDFKKFITKGDVLDLAVAVVIATAFNAIVNGLVKYIITPIMTFFTSGVSINEWEYVLRDEVLDEGGAVVVEKISVQYGVWLQSILDFLIIAFSIFVAVRIIRKMQRKIYAREYEKREAEAAIKKKADDEKAAEAAKLTEAEKAEKSEFYENVRAQRELLQKLYDTLDKR